MRAGIFAMLIALACRPALASLEINLTVASLPYQGRSIGLEPAPGNEAEPVQSAIHLILAPSYTWAEEGGEITIYDWGRRVIYVTSAGVTTERSLFSTVAGRAVEMQNRIYNSRLSAGAIPLVVSEHDLSMPSGAQTPPLRRLSSRDFIAFRGGELDLGDYSTEMIAATPAERAAFVRFVMYRFGAHPVILADLRRASGIPASLRLVRHVQAREDRISVGNARQLPDAPYRIGPARPVIQADPDVAAAAAAVQQTTGAVSAAAARDLLAEAIALADAKKNVASYLTFIEYLITAGEEPSAAGVQRAAALRADPNVRALQEAIGAPAGEAAATALATLASSPAQGEKNGYVLSVLEGEILLSLGDMRRARQKFAAALSRNPGLTGTWKDLGDLFFRTNDAVRAWDCYTIARRLAPRHAIAAEITRREEKLLRDYPDFFF